MQWQSHSTKSLPARDRQLQWAVTVSLPHSPRLCALGLGPHHMGPKSTRALVIVLSVLGYAEEVGIGSFEGLVNF